MSLVVTIPAEIAKLLVSTWLKIPDLCKLEVALCSPENHMSMMSIYDGMVVPCEQLSHHKGSFQKQLEWMIVRKMRISSLQIVYSLERSTKLASLVRSSKNLLKRLMICSAADAINTIVVALNQHCTQLECIEMNDCNLSKSFCQLLANSPHLNELQISSCTGLEASHFDGLVLPSVRTLGCDGECERDLQIALLRSCPQVTSYSRQQGEIADLSAVPEGLEELTLSECESVGPVQLPACVSKLWMKSCNVTDELLKRIMKQCPKLTVIDIQGNNALRGDCFAQMAQRYSRTLTALNVYNCPSLDQAALLEVCAKCKLLFHLDMGENPQFTASVYADVLDCCPSLRELLLEKMNISNEALVRIAAAPLEYLYMNEMRGLSDAGIAVLMDGCASMKQLVIFDKRVNSLVKFLWKRQRPDLNLNWYNGV